MTDAHTPLPVPSRAPGVFMSDSRYIELALFGYPFLIITRLVGIDTPREPGHFARHDDRRLRFAIPGLQCPLSDLLERRVLHQSCNPGGQKE